MYNDVAFRLLISLGLSKGSFYLVKLSFCILLCCTVDTSEISSMLYIEHAQHNWQ